MSSKKRFRKQRIDALKNDRSAVVQFIEYSLSESNGLIDINLTSDLPKDVRASIELYRLFKDEDGETWEFTLLSREIGLKEEGEHSILNFSEKKETLDLKGVGKYRVLAREMCLQMVGLPGQKLILEIEMPGKKQEHLFGICNRNLSGLHVLEEKSGHAIALKTEIETDFSEKGKEELRKGKYKPIE